jgi:hydroxyacylglutathione hydrolase
MSNVTSAAPKAPPLKAAIIPVTPLQQNCTLFWCTETNKAALVDPGGDLDKLKAAVAQTGVELEKLLVTHGHLDHCGQAGMLAKELGLPIEGPHEEDRFWIAKLDDDGARWGMEAHTFEPDRWLVDGDTVTVGNLTLDVIRLAIVGDVLFQGSIGRTDFPRGNHADLINAITTKLWPLGDDVTFIPGHGPTSQFGYERQHNAFVADDVLAAR